MNRLNGKWGAARAVFSAAIAGLFFAANAFAAALVQDVKGDVRAAVGAATPAPVEKGQNVPTGATITTGPVSQVILEFDDGQKVVLNENTQFWITDYQYEKENPKSDRSIFSLARGAARVVSGALAQRSRSAFEFRTEVATIGIRGTDFMVAIVDQPSYLSVLDGEVAATNTGGTATFAAGQFATISAATVLAVAIPAALLPAAASAAFGSMGAAAVGAGAAAAGGIGAAGAVGAVAAAAAAAAAGGGSSSSSSTPAAPACPSTAIGTVTSKSVTICDFDSNNAQDDDFNLLVNGTLIGTFRNAPGGKSCLNATLNSGTNTITLTNVKANGAGTFATLTVDPGGVSATIAAASGASPSPFTVCAP